MNDEESISLAKTEFREAYNTGDVNRLLSVFADSFVDMRVTTRSLGQKTDRTPK